MTSRTTKVFVAVLLVAAGVAKPLGVSHVSTSVKPNMLSQHHLRPVRVTLARAHQGTAAGFLNDGALGHLMLVAQPCASGRPHQVCRAQASLAAPRSLPNLTSAGRPYSGASPHAPPTRPLSTECSPGPALTPPSAPQPAPSAFRSPGSLSVPRRRQ